MNLSLVSRRAFVRATAVAGAGILQPRLFASAHQEYETIADSERDFDAVQGYDGWYYGFIDGPYERANFQPMPQYANDAWSAGDTQLTAAGGSVGADSRLAVRRWISSVNDKIKIIGVASASAGVTASIYADGRLLWTTAVEPNGGGTEFESEIRPATGTEIDFVVTPGAAATFLFAAVIARGGCSQCCSVSEPVSYSQLAAPWGPMTYHNKPAAPDGSHTIARCGCALTSLSMALYYAGFVNDPGTLNGHLNTYGGYDDEHRVVWDDALRTVSRVSGKRYRWRPVSGTTFAALEPTLCNSLDPTPGVFNAGFPLIVGVRRIPPPAGQPWKPQHFVLVTGFRRDNPLGQHFVDIVDPDGFRVRSLQQFHSFEIRGYAVDPPEEESGLNLMAGDAGLLLTDAAGRTTGYDLPQGAIQQIPNSSATIESFDLVAPAAPDDGFSSHITITNPDAGSYRLALISETSGTHVVTIHAYSSDGSPQPEVKVPIESNAGERVEVEFSYSPVPGSVPEFVQTIEFFVERDQVNLGSHGVITIVIPSSETFNASTVDPLSVRFGPAGASEAHQRGHLESGDLVLHFRVDECGLDAAMTSVCLIGQTLAGKRIRGCAPIHLRD